MFTKYDQQITLLSFVILYYCDFKFHFDYNIIHFDSFVFDRSTFFLTLFLYLSCCQLPNRVIMIKLYIQPTIYGYAVDIFLKSFK